MGKRSLIFGFCALVLFISFSGCIAKKRNTQTVPLKNVSSSVRTDYAPPQDSLITLAQMRNWLTCNHLLDSLSFLYQDSFQTKDSHRRLAYQDAFVTAQNAICTRCGLTGGYNEYLWILKNAGDPRNRSVLDSVGLASY